MAAAASTHTATGYPTQAEVHGSAASWVAPDLNTKELGYATPCPSCGVRMVIPLDPVLNVQCFQCDSVWVPPHVSQPDNVALREPIHRVRARTHSLDSFKNAVNFVIHANTGTSKVKIVNKIGSVPKGTHRDFALALQRGLKQIRLTGESVVRWNRGTVRETVQAVEPDLFAQVRSHCGVSEREYNASLELPPESHRTHFTVVGAGEASGKSPSFFLLSPDQKFILKTCTVGDYKCLLRILRPYVNHLGTHRDTWISKFFGLYTVKIGARHASFLAMNNFFAGQYAIHEKYDLKGSTYRREASARELRKKSPVYKDLDWMRSGHRWEFKGSREQAMETLKQDVRFLAQQGIIDYSLLVGVHKRAAQTDPSWHEPAPHPIRSLVLRQVTEKTIIYFGIVDILTPYSTRKKLEKFYQHSLRRRSGGMNDASCTDPQSYAKRFFEFIEKYSVDHLPTSPV